MKFLQLIFIQAKLKIVHQWTGHSASQQQFSNASNASQLLGKNASLKKLSICYGNAQSQQDSLLKTRFSSNTYKIQKLLRHSLCPCRNDIIYVGSIQILSTARLLLTCPRHTEHSLSNTKCNFINWKTVASYKLAKESKKMEMTKSLSSSHLIRDGSFEG